MIEVRCQCGAGHSLRESEAGRFTACPACRTGVRLLCAGPVPTGTGFSARLVAIVGPRELGEQLFLGGSAPLEIGKLPGKHLLLPGTLVSRNHGRLVPTAAGWRLVDDGSTNGSFVNGHRVTSHDLRDGDHVRLGEFEFEYRGGNAGDAGGAGDAVGEESGATATPGEAANPFDDEGLFEVAYDVAEPPPAPRPAAIGTAFTPPAAPVAMATLAAGPYRPVFAPGQSLPCPTCPSCSKSLGPGARICVACGIDVRNGRPIITAQGLDEDSLHVHVETTLRILSWVIPFGFYPIASEAYGKFKPYAIWAIAALTVLTTLAVWGTGNTHKGAARDLALWTGTLTPRAADFLYSDERVPFVNDADRAAYAQKVEDLQGTVPEEQLPLAAYEALPADHQVFGHFQPHQLLTHAFLHGGTMHLAGNLLFLLVFGSRVNALIGQWKAALLYPLLAVIAGGAYALSQTSRAFPVPMVGASGAIMGLAGMYLVLFPVHRVHNAIWLRLGLVTGFRLMFKVFAVRGFWVVLFYIAFDVFFTVLNVHDNVAHWAHLGGFLGGMAVALVLLLTRLIDARGGDLLSVVLGKHAWPLLGKPGQRGAVPTQMSLAVGPA